MATSEITVVGKATFDSEVKNSKLPVLVDFYATWCGPCKQIAPILSELAKEEKERVKIVKVDVDEDPELAKEYGVRGIPTLIIFNQGEIAKTMVGFKTKDDLLEAINSVLASGTKNENDDTNNEDE